MIGPAARQIQSVQIQKGYDNRTVFTFDVDEAAVAEHLIGSFDLDRDDLRAVQGIESLAELHQHRSEMETRSDRLHELLAAVISNYQAYSAHQTVAHMLLKFFISAVLRITATPYIEQNPGLRRELCLMPH